MNSGCIEPDTNQHKTPYIKLINKIYMKTTKTEPYCAMLCKHKHNNVILKQNISPIISRYPIRCYPIINK